MMVMSKNSRWISLLLKNHLANDTLSSLNMVARMFLLQMRIRCSMFTQLLIINLIDRSLVVHYVLFSFLGDNSCLMVMLFLREVRLHFLCVQLNLIHTWFELLRKYKSLNSPKKK